MRRGDREWILDIELPEREAGRLKVEIDVVRICRAVSIRNDLDLIEGLS